MKTKTVSLDLRHAKTLADAKAYATEQLARQEAGGIDPGLLSRWIIARDYGPFAFPASTLNASA